MDELEMIDADSQKVASMLSALPRVEAPANFEFRVKAGVAKGKPSDSVFLPLLKTAAPLALILVVVTLGFLYYQKPAETQGDPTGSMSMTAPVSPQTQIQPLPVSTAAAQPPQDTTPVKEERASKERVAQPARSANPTSNNRAEGNSKELILHPARVIMPPGTESANPQNRTANTSPSSSTDTPVREVLEIFGVEGEFADGGWKVLSVKANSIGSRAKLAVGDVIESIDGQQIKSDTKLKSVKSFTIRRGGKTLTLSAGN